jgi:hypothetical protein
MYSDNSVNKNLIPNNNSNNFAFNPYTNNQQFKQQSVPQNIGNNPFDINQFSNLNINQSYQGNNWANINMNNNWAPASNNFYPSGSPAFQGVNSNVSNVPINQAVYVPSSKTKFNEVKFSSFNFHRTSLKKLKRKRQAVRLQKAKG